MNRVPSVHDTAVAFGQRYPNPCLLVDADTMLLVAHERAVGALVMLRALQGKPATYQNEMAGRLAMDCTEAVWATVLQELDL